MKNQKDHAVNIEHDLPARGLVILATDGFERVELIEPNRKIEKAGALVERIQPQGTEIRGWTFRERSDSIKPNLPLDKSVAAEFYALVLPGAVINPDRLRVEPRAIRFIRKFVETGRPMTPCASVETELLNAEALREVRRGRAGWQTHCPPNAKRYTSRPVCRGKSGRRSSTIRKAVR